MCGTQEPMGSGWSTPLFQKYGFRANWTKLGSVKLLKKDILKIGLMI